MLNLTPRRRTRSAKPRPTLKQCASDVFERLPQRERLVLTLLLVERMTLVEAAEVLGITAVELDHIYCRVLAGLRRLAIRSGFDPFYVATRRLGSEQRLRKAS